MFQCIIKQLKTKRKIFQQSWTKPLETFSLFSTIANFRVWKGSFALQIDIWGNSVAKRTWKSIFQKEIFCTLESSMNLGPNVLPVAAGKYLISDFTFIY